MKALLRMQWINLKRDRPALALTFLLPIGFFSIFALVFGGVNFGSSGGGDAGLVVLCVNEDETRSSERFLETFGEQEGIELTREFGQPGEAPDRERAVALVRGGEAPAAVIIPAGFGEQFGSFGDAGARVELVHDAANPIALHMLTGLLQASSFQAAPDLLLESGLEALESFGGGPMTPAQKQTMDELRVVLAGADDDQDGQGDAGEADAQGGPAGSGFTGLIQLETRAAQARVEDGEPVSPSMVSYYAAAIGVMFLLFSMAGAASSILEQEEFGTLERLLTSRLTLNRLLLAHWTFFTLIGIAQLVIMFLFGAFVFGLDLFSVPTLVGTAAMSILTSGSAAAFGLMLAALCRSRAQLSGLSTIIILTMSALGGCMMPKFIASFLETTSKFTFNGWALDGFLKVFWYRQPEDGVREVLSSILPQVGVLVVLSFVFLSAARIAARRWERV